MNFDKPTVRFVLEALFDGRSAADVVAEFGATLEGGTPQEFVSAIERFREENRGWVNTPGIRGAGVERRVVNEDEKFFINVYIDKDYQTDPRARVPPSLHLLGKEVQLEHELIQKPRSSGGSQMPQVSHGHGIPGTLGCLVKKQGSNAIYLLSACHVIGRWGLANAGDSVVDANHDQIATITNTNDITEFTYSQPGAVTYHVATDSAIAKALPSFPAVQTPGAIGAHVLTTTSLVEDQMITMHGCVTGIAHGRIKSCACMCSSDDFLDQSGAKRKVGFRNVVMTRSHMADPGDSGGIVTSGNELVGLIIMTSGSHTWFHPIDRVFRDRGVQLMI